MKRSLSLLAFIALLALPLRANTYTVTNTNDWFWGSLRQAIDDANGHAGPDKIVFNITTASKTIHLETPLPNITDTVTIDGWTQPGYFGNPIIELDGTKVKIGLGLMIYAPNTVVRGLVINRFGYSGIGISDDFAGHVGHGTVIQGCWIGVGLDGRTALRNGRDGIRIYANDVVIGGDAAYQRNVISGNANCGISIGKEGWGGQMGGDRGQRNQVRGNYIGTNATGTSDVGNRCGVEIVNGSDNVIGGDTPAMGNVISGNGGSGVHVAAFEWDNGASQGVKNTIVKNNKIGVRSDGAALGNGSSGGDVAGVMVYAPQTTIVQNTISNNNGAGVMVRVRSGTQIYNNSMFNNNGLGIDLGGYYDTGVTPNDPLDADSGGNGLLNFPAITSAVNDAGTHVIGSYSGAANTLFTLDFYRAPNCKPNGYGEGESLVGSFKLTTDGNGFAAYDTNIPFAGIGQTLVAVARDPANSTSEFSQCRTVVYPPPRVTGLSKPGGRVGTPVTIYGTSLTWINTVKFFDGYDYTRNASFGFNGDGSITTTVPTGAKPGQIFISGQYGGTLTPLFTVTPPQGDFTADGRPDLVWRNYRTGGDYIDDFNGNTTYVLPGVVDPLWQIQGTGDFDNDGSHDIVWRHYGTGETRIWRMQGRVYTGSDIVLPAVTDMNWHIAAVADMDGDGDPDLIWRHYGTGANLIWLMNGGTYTGATASLPAVTGTWRIEGAGDFNLDGSADLLWRNYTTGQNVIWHMNGPTWTGMTTTLPTIPDTNWIIEGAYDWDQDGDLDILWRNAATGQNEVWPMIGTYWDGATYIRFNKYPDPDVHVEDQ